MGRVTLVEFVENVLDRFLIHAAAGIRYGDDHVAAGLLLAQHDAPARLGELDRVGDQVVEDDLQHALVRQDHHALLELRVKVDVLPFPLLLVRQGAVAELSREVIRRGIGHNLLILQLVEPQDIGDEHAEALAGRGNRCRILALLLLAQVAALQRASVAADDGQRRLDLMRHVGDEIVLHGLDTGELVYHAVEVLEHEVHVVKLVPLVHGLDGHGEIPLGHGAHGAAEAAHGLVILGTAHLMDDDRRDDRHGDPVRAHAHAGQYAEDLHLQENLHDEHVRRAEQAEHQQDEHKHAPGERFAADARVLLKQRTGLAGLKLNLRQLNLQIAQSLDIHTAGTAL